MDNFKYVIACGARRSASTFQYQVAKYLVEDRGLGRGIGFIKHVELPSPEDGCLIVKTHAWLPQALSHLENGTAIGLHIRRDVRDVIASTMRLFDFDFERAMAEIRGITKERYEWGKAPKGSVLTVEYRNHISTPSVHVIKIANVLLIEVKTPEAIQIAEMFSPINQKKRMPESGDPHEVDPHSQLHGNHIHSGKPGMWQEVITEEQGAEVIDAANREWAILLSEEEDAE